MTDALGRAARRVRSTRSLAFLRRADPDAGRATSSACAAAS